MSTRRLAAIMFTDIVGYTSLMGKDEEYAIEILAINREIHNTILSRYRGTLIKEMGDGILASFSSNSDAVRCALEIQEEAKAENIKLRIGIHEGEMIFTGDDVLGDGVNVASRLEELAEEGCINISWAVYKDIKNKTGISAEFVEEKTLKNVEEPVKVYKVTCEQDYLVKKSVEDREPKISVKRLPYYVFALAFIVIAALFIWFRPEKQPVINLQKSIAVLPFETITKDSASQYIAEGVREAILNNLQKIKDLEVGSRTSSETYRNSPKRIPEIASELNVASVMEGSAQKFGDQIRITVQLIDGKTDKHIWSENYDREWGDIFLIYSEIAEEVARALQVVITPEEKQKIDAVPTKNVTAYDYILQGRQEQWKYWLKGDTIALGRAENLYDKALKLDPDYALGWDKKGSIYWEHNYSKEYFKENYMDSVLWYCEKAITLDPDLGDPYLVKGMVYHYRGNIESATNYFEKTFELAESQNNNITSREALWRLGFLYLYKKDYVEGISLIQDAVQRAKGSPNDYSHLLHRLGYAYLLIGEYEKAESYYIQSNTLRGHDLRICYFYTHMGNSQASIDCALAYYQTNSSDQYCIYLLANNYLQIRDFESSLTYFQRLRNITKEEEYIQGIYLYREGFTLIQLGREEEGEKLIEDQLILLDKSKKLGRPDGYDYHYAAIYAFMGDYKRALQHLRDYEKKVLFPGPITNLIPVSYIQYDILFENLWDNDEFKSFIKELQEEKAAIQAQIREMDRGKEMDQ
jgi:TolB-like protein/Tfp pilus assembly protein PilF